MAGATLVEVLISILVASVGMLAMAGLSAAALKYSKLSQSRATAGQLATELAERMRASAFGAGDLAAYAFVQPMAAQSTLPDPPGTLCQAVTDTCTVPQLAAAELWQWRANVRSQLPSGSVAVAPDPGAARNVDIWVAWREPAPAAESEVVRTGGAKECPLSLETTDDLNVRCVHMRVRL